MTTEGLKGLRVLLTGAASGIGRATTLRLANEGAALFVADVNEGGLADLVAEAPAISAKRMDVSNEDDVRALVQDAALAMGGIDAVINLAGVLSFANSHEVTMDDWQRILNINLTGTFLVCREALPHLVESRGVIVNAASTAAHQGQAWAAAYCASKGAILAMSRALAVEYAGRGVRVNTVSPGAIVTPIMDAFAFPEGADTRLIYRTMPIGPSGTPEDAAAAIVHLVHPESHYINGADLRVDGATTA